MKLRPLCLTLCLALSAGCSLQLPDPVRQDIFLLPPARVQDSETPALHHGLRLAAASSSEALAGPRLLVRMPDHSLQVMGDARWQTAIPPLWRDWLLDAFWRDGRITGLSSDLEGLQASHELGGMLLAFNAVSLAGEIQAEILFDARLVDLKNRQIIASQRFEQQVPATDRSAAAVVAAMGQAASALSEALIAWTAEQLQED